MYTILICLYAGVKLFSHIKRRTAMDSKKEVILDVNKNVKLKQIKKTS